MKAGEIRQKTGLTEKAMRLYEDKGLVHPEIHEQGNRRYREYSEDDLAVLEKIKLLRRLGVSIEELKALSAGTAELSHVLADALPMPEVCHVAAFVLLWLIVILVARLVGALLTSLLDKLLAIGMLNRLLGGILSTAKFALVLGSFIWLFSAINLISPETMQTSQLCRPLKALPEYTYNVIRKHAPQAGQEISTCLSRKKGVPNEQ